MELSSSSAFNGVSVKFYYQEDGLLHENFVFTCSNSKALAWLVISYVYKAVLQMLGLLMAFSTRKIKIKPLNDSKEVTAIISVNSVVLTLLVVTEFGLHSHIEIYSALFSMGLVVGATIFTGIVFIPKMVSLYRDPNGKNVFSTSENQQAAANVLNQFHGKVTVQASVEDKMAAKERTTITMEVEESTQSASPEVQPSSQTLEKVVVESVETP